MYTYTELYSRVRVSELVEGFNVLFTGTKNVGTEFRFIGGHDFTVWAEKYGEALLADLGWGTEHDMMVSAIWKEMGDRTILYFPRQVGDVEKDLDIEVKDEYGGVQPYFGYPLYEDIFSDQTVPLMTEALQAWGSAISGHTPEGLFLDFLEPPGLGPKMRVTFDRGLDSVSC